MFDENFLPHIIIETYLQTHAHLSDREYNLLYQEVIANPYNSRFTFNSKI